MQGVLIFTADRFQGRFRDHSAQDDRMAYGLMFHHFCDQTHPKGQGAISAEEFESILQFAGIENILPALEWKARAEQGKLKETDVCITFDDSLRCQYDVAKPVLDRYGLTAFWFVYSSVFEGVLAPLEVYRYFRTVSFSEMDQFYAAFDRAIEQSPWRSEVSGALGSYPADYLAEYSFFTASDRRFRYIRDEILGAEKYNGLMDQMVANAGFDEAGLRSLLWMNNNNLKQLHGDGHVVGLHSYSHPMTLGRLSFDEQSKEYFRNHEHLSAVLGSPPTTVSHPSNSYNEDTLRILKWLGVSVGFRADMAPGYSSSLELPREDHSNVLRSMRASA